MKQLLQKSTKVMAFIAFFVMCLKKLMMVDGSSMDYLNKTILTMLIKNLMEAVVHFIDLLLRNLMVIPV